MVALAFMTCQLKYTAVILLTIGVALKYVLFFSLNSARIMFILLVDSLSVVDFYWLQMILHLLMLE
jgi:hypothetical protein